MITNTKFSNLVSVIMSTREIYALSPELLQQVPGPYFRKVGPPLCFYSQMPLPLYLNNQVWLMVSNSLNSLFKVSPEWVHKTECNVGAEYDPCLQEHTAHSSQLKKSCLCVITTHLQQTTFLFILKDIKKRDRGQKFHLSTRNYK